MEGLVGLAAQGDGDLFVCMISTGNQAQVARMVALWFAHYAAAPLWQGPVYTSDCDCY